MKRANLPRIVAGSGVSLASAIVSILATAPAMAQDSGGSLALEEIVVTATRREQSLQDVPLSVSAITADSLKNRGISGLQDIKVGAVPGLVITNFAGASSVLIINMRGVSTPDSTQGTTEMGVPLYIDGVFLGRGQGLGTELIEPERIEVLRGPQGQLFGRNAEGGVIQYVSRKPLGAFGIRASASGGNYSSQNYKFAVDLPSVAGVSSQFSYVKNKRDPLTRNVPTGLYADQADFGILDTWGARGALRWKNDFITADYSYDYSKMEDSQPYTVWTPEGFTPPPGSPTPPQPPSSDYPRQIPALLPSGAALGPVFNRPFDTKASGHQLTVAYTVSNEITLKSISSYRKTSRHGGSNLGWALPVNFGVGLVTTQAQEDIDQNQGSEELQFIGTWDQFDLTMGAMYYHEHVDDGRISNLAGPGIVPFAALFGVTVPADYVYAPSKAQQDSTSNSYGIYGQATYRPDWAKGLEGTVGLRYTNDRKLAHRTYNYDSSVDPAFGFNGPYNQLAEPLLAKFKASRVDPAATIKYSWTEGLSTYIRYSVGYRAGGANVRSSSFNSFKEEVNKALELGVKSLLWDSRLMLNLALYSNDIEHEQIAIQEQPTVNPALTSTINGPPKKVKGVELESSLSVFEGMTVGLNASYMSAKKFADVYNPIANEYDRLFTVNVPRWSGSLTANYQTRQFSFGRMTFHADYIYSDKYITSPRGLNVNTFSNNAFPNYPTAATAHQLNARASLGEIPVGAGQLEVALWGKNLTDNRDIEFSYGGCGFGAGDCTYRNQPRMYGGEVSYKY